MRPYLAIIRDSFDEALASRVLWILIILSTLFLAALAPLGVSEQADALLRPSDITDATALAKKLKSRGQNKRPSPARRIFELAGEDFKRTLAAMPAKSKSPADDGALHNQLADELNTLLQRADLFDESDWKSVHLDQEAKGLLDQGLGKLPPERLERFNRLALEAAFPKEIARSGPPRLQFYYLAWDVGSPMAIQRDDLVAGIKQALHFFLYFVLGVGGTLAAIVVTAWIIPQTFEPGAIDLLLSKPVSRPLVFLTKFVGGCAFITLIVAWLIGGLWLILWARFGIWNPRMLLCIPLYLFLFAIYYGVSSLTGVIWKNAIVSVVLTILFWFVCFSVGTTKDLLETAVINPQRIVKIVPAGGALLAVNESGKVERWQATSREWDQVMMPETGGNRPIAFGLFGGMVGPVYDAHEQRILAIDKPLQQFGPMNRPAPLLIGKPGQDWRRIEGPAAPAGTEVLLVDSQGTPLAVTPSAVFRLKGSVEAKPQPVKVMGIELPLEGDGSKFVEASPPLQMSTPLSASMNAAKSELAVFDGRRLLLLAADGQEKYRVRIDTELNDYLPGLVAYAGQTLFVARSDGSVQQYDPADLRLEHEWTLKKNSAPRFLAASPDGRWVAAVFHDGRLWLYDTQKQVEVSPAGAGLHDVSAVTLTDSNRLLVADDNTRVTEYDLAAGKVLERRQPARSTIEALYYYAIKPIYTVFPKPGELDNMVHYLLTDEISVPVAGKRQALGATRVRVDIWGPVWSNLAFLAVVLGIGCVYVSRKDF
jgi:ABC-type transport system involved in multi-copper enzyme maturation permease subunit